MVSVPAAVFTVNIGYLRFCSHSITVWPLSFNHSHQWRVIKSWSAWRMRSAGQLLIGWVFNFPKHAG